MLHLIARLSYRVKDFLSFLLGGLSFRLGFSSWIIRHVGTFLWFCLLVYIYVCIYRNWLMGFNLTGTTIDSFYFAKPSGWNTGFKRWNFSFLPSEDKTGFRSLSKETFPISNDSRSTRREIDSKLLACRLSEKITHERLLFFLEKQSHSNAESISVQLLSKPV